MSSTFQTMPNPDGGTTAYLEIEGQVYPAAARKKVKRPRTQGPARGAASEKNVADRVREQFYDLFVMNLDDAEYTDNGTLLEDYSFDINLICDACDEARDMLKRLYRLNTRFEFQEKDAEWSIATDEEALRDKQYRNWSKDLSLGIQIGDYGLSTQLTQLLKDEGLEGLRRKRDTCLDDFIGQFCRLLDQMVEHEIAGLVVFGEDRDCDFHFFREAVVDFRADTRTVTYISKGRTFFNDLGQRIVERSGTQADIKKERTTIRRTRQDIYLRDVNIAPFGQSRMPIPPDIHDFIASLPKWLQSAVQIVEGDRYSQRCYEYEVKHINWETTKLRPYLSRVVQEVHRDPALTLGQYVLTGWDDSDVERQNKMQEDAWRARQTQTSAGMAGTHSISMLMAAAISLIVTILGFCLLSGNASQLAGAIGATAFTVCGLSWFHSGAQALHKRTNGVHYLLAGVGCVVFMASILTATQAVRVGDWGIFWVILFAPMALCGLWKLRELLPDGQ